MNREFGYGAILVMNHGYLSGGGVFDEAACVIVCYFFKKFHFWVGMFIYDGAESRNDGTIVFREFGGVYVI